MTKAKYFSESEFKKCTPKCSLQDMDQSFMSKLDTARNIAGIPFVLNSAYRSKEWEIKQGRAGTSSHCEGKAVDIRCGSDYSRFIIIDALLKAGFNRIGVAKTFIHVDSSTTHSQKVTWLYQ